MEEVDEASIFGILDRVQRFDATRALKEAKVNIDSLNKVQRYSGFNQAAKLNCDCTEDQITAYQQQQQQQQNAAVEDATMNDAQDGQGQTGAASSNAE